jgi:hypothetical protein
MARVDVGERWREYVWVGRVGGGGGQWRQQRQNNHSAHLLAPRLREVPRGPIVPAPNTHHTVKRPWDKDTSLQSGGRDHSTASQAATRATRRKARSTRTDMVHGTDSSSMTWGLMGSESTGGGRGAVRGGSGEGGTSTRRRSSISAGSYKRSLSPTVTFAVHTCSHTPSRVPAQPVAPWVPR